jgi:hypothetical protein
VTERGADENPTWSPDGRTLTYVTSTGKEYQVYQVAADGSGSSTLLMQGAKMIPNDWSPDGKPPGVDGFSDRFRTSLSIPRKTSRERFYTTGRRRNSQMAGVSGSRCSQRARSAPLS